MNIAKKILAGLLTLGLLVGCTACTKEKSVEQTTALNVWAIQSAQVTDYATNAQSLWMKEKTGVDVNWLAVPQEGWYSSFQSSVMADEKVDVYLYHFDSMEASMLGEDMQVIIPLEELITPENTPNICAILEANPQIKKAITSPSGHIYTLFQTAYDVSAYKQKMWCNKDWLAQYTQATGNGMPQTTAEFKEMLQYFKANDMNGNGKADEVAFCGVDGVDGCYYLFNAFLPCNSSSEGFGSYFKDDGSLSFSYETEEFKQALEFVRSLYSQGLIHPDTFTISYEERYAMTSGDKSSVRVGVVSAPDASSVVQLSDIADTMQYDDYVVIPPLTGPNGTKATVSAGEVVISMKNAITTKCKDPVAAIKWLDAGYSEAAKMYSLYGGLEGKAWEYTEGTTLDGQKEVINTIGKQSENACWGNQGIVYNVDESDITKIDVSQIATNNTLATLRANLEYRPYLIKSGWPSIVWAGDSNDEANEYSELCQLLNKAVTEYYTAVITGKSNTTEDWDAYITELNTISTTRFLELVSLYIDSAAN